MNSLKDRVLKGMTPTHSPLRLIVILSLSIFLAECEAMLLLSYLPPFPVWWGALLDACMMLVLISPTLYLLVFLPLIRLVEERKRGEKALQQANEELDSRVKERTAQLELMNRDLQNEIVERKRMEAETTRYMQNLEYLSIAGTRFLEQQTYEEIFGYAAGRIAGVVESGVVVASEYDPASHSTIVRAVRGDEQGIQTIARILGSDIVGLRLAVDPAIKKRLRKGKLTEVKGGIYGLTFRRLSEQVCLQIESELGHRHIFAIPFLWEEDLLGTITILTRENLLPPPVRVIETIVSQAAIALKRLRMQEEVQRSTERFELAVRGTNDGIWDWDIVAGTDYFSPRWSELLGFGTDELPQVLETWVSRLHPDERDWVLDRVRQHLERDVPYDLEYRMCHKSGEYRWFHARGQAIRDREGKPVRMAGSITDITERKEAEEKFRLRAEEYRLLMEEASDGVFLGDVEKGISAANQCMCEMLGYERDEVPGLKVRELLPEEDRSIIPGALKELNEGKAIVVQHRFRRKDGTLIDVETNAKKLVDGRIQAIVRDVTAQKAKQQQFREAIKEEVFEKLFLKLRAFKHGESGAMNLNRLALFAENLPLLVRTGGAGAPAIDQGLLRRFELAVEEYINIVFPELKHIASLVTLSGVEDTRSHESNALPSSAETLLLLAGHLKQSLQAVVTLIRSSGCDSADTACQTLQSDVLSIITRIRYAIKDVSSSVDMNFTCDVSKVVKAVAHKFESTTSDVSIECTDLTGMCKVLFNASELGKVVSILIENSIEACGIDGKTDAQQKGRIRIRTEKDGVAVRITLEDNGPGVPAEIGDRIFENGMSGKSPDRGFGLSYARSCVRKYGGRIQLDQTFQSGARFVIDVPKA